MKGTSKVIMGATLVMVVTLAVVLVLIFVLLAELYCSLLLRRRHLKKSNSNNTLPTATTQATTVRANASSPSHTTSHHQQQSPPFSSIYAQGVLQAPRSILLPAVSCKEEKAEPRRQKHYSELHQVLQIQLQPQGSNSNASPSPPPSFISITPSKPNPLPGSTIENLSHHDDKRGGEEEHLVYISNPIYENDESQVSGANTPFETPDTSPSRLEGSGSSEEDEATPCVAHSPLCTPPLTPMKKLPAEACSVSLRDARSLGTSCSDSRSNNGLSSSSVSPCTSPSW